MGEIVIDKKVKLKETPYGFSWGPMNIERVVSDEAKEWVVVNVESKKHCVQVYVTKTGKIRVWFDHKELTDPKCRK
jgi:hypothetical protein